MSDLPNAAREVLDFWIGPLDEDGAAESSRREIWWSSSDELDREIRERFFDLRGRAMAGAVDEWASSARGRLAVVIVLDQFSRNMFRGTADMFSADAKAADLTREGIDLGHDLELAGDERKFLYMPLMHSERMSEQHMGMGVFGAARGALTSRLPQSGGANSRLCAAPLRDRRAIWSLPRIATSYSAGSRARTSRRSCWNRARPFDGLLRRGALERARSWCEQRSRLLLR